MKKLWVIAAAAVVAGNVQAQAQSIEGEVALSFGRAPFLSTDDDDERLSKSGYAISGWAGTTIGDWRVFGDANVYRRDIGTEDFDSYAPEGARSIGLHFGRNFQNAYVGAFLGRNQFQGADASATNGYVWGNLYGIEGQYDMGNVSVFGQIGRAKMVGHAGDSAFIGGFGKIGVSATVDKLVLTAEYEKGRSSNIFEDNTDWGTYGAIGVSVDYQVTDRVIATVGYQKMDITANTEDTGYDEFYSVGIRIPLGTSSKRNNLTTSYRPGLAAAWAENLD